MAMRCLVVKAGTIHYARAMLIGMKIVAASVGMPIGCNGYD